MVKGREGVGGLVTLIVFYSLSSKVYGTLDHSFGLELVSEKIARFSFSFQSFK